MTGWKMKTMKMYFLLKHGDFSSLLGFTQGGNTRCRQGFPPKIPEHFTGCTDAQEKPDPTAELKMPKHLENLEASWLVGFLQPAL